MINIMIDLKELLQIIFRGKRTPQSIQLKAIQENKAYEQETSETFLTIVYKYFIC